jgi:hypothetical protein
MTMSNELRAEIETIMTEHQRTRLAKVLVGMSNGLSDDEMSAQADAAREPIRADSIAAIGPNVRFTPLRDVRLGANDGSGADKPEPPRCPDCGLHHAGECF